LHSTDTEPEAETDNRSNILKTLKFSSKDGTKQKISNDKSKRNVFEDFLEGIPSFEYDEQQIRRNQAKSKNKKNKKSPVTNDGGYEV